MYAQFVQYTDEFPIDIITDTVCLYSLSRSNRISQPQDGPCHSFGLKSTPPAQLSTK